MEDKYYTPEIEIWMNVKGYEDEYEVSELGNVRRKRKNLSKPINIDGYEKVTLCKNGECINYLVHRLIAGTFLKNLDNKPQVHHKDFNKSNNHISNLEWVTEKENCQYNVEEGYLRDQNGENNNMSKLVEKDVLFIRELLDDGITAYQIHKEYYPYLHQQTIYAIKQGRLWKHI